MTELTRKSINSLRRRSGRLARSKLSNASVRHEMALVRVALELRHQRVPFGPHRLTSMRSIAAKSVV